MTITLVLKQLDVWNHTTSLPNCFIVVCVCTPCLSSLLPQKYVRAHFNYSPKTDDEIPCQPLGLRFEKGDILEISNQDDPDWWQVIHVVIMPTVLFSGIVAFLAIHTVRTPLFSNYCTHALVIIKTEWFNVFCILFTSCCVIGLQARKVFDDGAESLPGLIPARHRQQQSVHQHSSSTHTGHTV